MELKDMITRRKSGRSYTLQPVDEVTIQKIKEFAAGLKPLYPNIQVKSEIVSRDKVKSMMSWIPPQVMAVYSEEAEGYLENVGFMFQQLDLYLQSLGLSVCWVGLGKVNQQQAVEAKGKDKLKFVILLTFGYPKGENQRQDVSEFKRKKLEEIADRLDERLEPARLAPSSVNSQPWFFAHEGDVIHAYCVKGLLLKLVPLGDMNHIDMGIALAHMYVANKERFEFFKGNAKPIKGYEYIGSFKI